MSFRDKFKSVYSTEDLLKAFKDEGKNKYVDERFWKPTVDPKTGLGGALIRFLPSKHNKTPFVRIYEHSFQGPTGQWYIEKSLTTIGLPDPVSEYNTAEWMTGDEAKQNEVRKRKRKTSFITNIYVIKDPANPENEGKVFLFKFGKKIFDKIMQLLEPPSDGIEEIKPVDPFDLFEGCNFVLRVKKGEGGFPNYDDSKFESHIGPLFKDESQIEKVYEMTYDLNEFVDPESFKSYDELKKKFYSVMGFKNDENVVSNQSKENKLKNDEKNVDSQTKTKSKNDVDVEEDDDVYLDQLLNKVRSVMDEDDEVPF